LDLVQVSAKDLETDDLGAPETDLPNGKTLAKHTLQIMANKISHILGSDKVSDDVKIAFQSIISETSNEANVGIDSPEFIKTSLPLLINALDADYGRGVVHALRALLDSGLANSVENELTQYEKRFDGRTEDELRILDLSNSTIEDLAQSLSDLMHNPNLPKKIYECLEEKLNVSHTDFYSAENILGNLKELQQKGKANDE
jgi:hypothetical protein